MKAWFSTSCSVLLVSMLWQFMSQTAVDVPCFMQRNDVTEKGVYGMTGYRQGVKGGEYEIPRIRIYEHEVQLIAKEVASWPNLETGGYVFGFWDHRGNAIGHFFSGPGRTAVHGYAHFEEDAEFLQLTHAHANRLHGVETVMRVHSHHRLGLTRPSSGDARSQASFMARNGFRSMFELIATFPEANASNEPMRPDDDSCLLVTTGGSRPTGRKNDALGSDCGAPERVTIRMHCYLHEPLNGGYRPCAVSLLPGVSPLREALFGMTEDKCEPVSGVRRESLENGPQRDFSGKSIAKLIVQLKQECALLPPAVRHACEFIPSDNFVVLKIPARNRTLLVAYRPEHRVCVEAVYVQTDDMDAPPLNITAEVLGCSETFSLVETLRAVQDAAWPHKARAAGLPENNVEDPNHGCPESLDAGEKPSFTAKPLDAGMEG